MRKPCLQCKAGAIRQTLLRCYVANTPNDTVNSIRWSKDITIRNSNEEQHTPLAILLGWGNGHYKHLSKYSLLFEKHNFTTVCLTTSLLKLFTRPVSMANQCCADILRATSELTNQNKDRPVIVMTFSNTGTAVFYSLVKHLHKDPSSLNLIGTIFDSCPIPMNKNAIRASENGALAYFKSSSLFTKFMVKNITKVLSGIVLYTNPVRKVFLTTLVESTCPGPQLFLFSEADELVRWEDIEDFVKERQLRGVEVYSRRWKDSKHVRHLNTHSEEYEAEVDEFIHRCLDSVSTHS